MNGILSGEASKLQADFDDASARVADASARVADWQQQIAGACTYPSPFQDTYNHDLDVSNLLCSFQALHGAKKAPTMSALKFPYM